MDVQEWWDLAVKLGVVGTFLFGVFIVGLYRHYWILYGDHKTLIAQYDLRLAESEKRRKDEKAEYNKTLMLQAAEIRQWENTAMTALRAGREWYDEKATKALPGTG